MAKKWTEYKYKLSVKDPYYKKGKEWKFEGEFNNRLSAEQKLNTLAYIEDYKIDKIEV